MPSPTSWRLFLSAALVLALLPGPGMLYVLARTLGGGRRAGVAASLGTASGGLGHVLGAAVGLSAVLATSAAAYSVVRYAGAAYLVYLGLQTLLGSNGNEGARPSSAGGAGRAYRQGVVTELLNPKTALFFLAFLPQFVNRNAAAAPQLLLLGAVSVLLNSSADVIVALAAGAIGGRLRAGSRLLRGERFVSGGLLLGLGAYVAVAGHDTHR
jgi:threonine/homoserine/homoserine lactone efflux protein